MKITQSFSVARPIAEVWALFQDVPVVATCMPGAELTADKGNGVYGGRIAIKLGPFSAAFEGQAVHTSDAASHRGHVEGAGIDKRGGSRSKLLLDYELAEAAGMTTATIDADVQLSGPIAQFGRTGLINETAAVLIKQFASNVEAKLAASAVSPQSPATTGSPPPAENATASQLSVGHVIWAVLKAYAWRLFGRSA